MWNGAVLVSACVAGNLPSSMNRAAHQTVTRSIEQPRSPSRYTLIRPYHRNRVSSGIEIGSLRIGAAREIERRKVLDVRGLGYEPDPRFRSEATLHRGSGPATSLR